MLTTWLFCPGHDVRKIRKALVSEADVVILDWEDAVPPAAKAEARRVSRDALDEHPTKRVVAIRANAVGSPWSAADREAIEHLQVEFVLIPKVEAPGDVTDFALLGLPLLPMIESAKGVAAVALIAAADAPVSTLAFGPLDYLADIRGRWTARGEPLDHPRAAIVVAARVAGLTAPIDGVFPDLADVTGLADDARRARTHGFGGKMLVHPSQLAPIRTGFEPSEEEVRRAREILTEQERVGESRAAFRVGAMMVDPPVIRWAEEIIRYDARVRERSSPATPVTSVKGGRQDVDRT